MKLLIAALFLACSTAADAYEADRAKTELASELSTCSAYYALMSHALERQNEDSTKTDQAGYFSFSLASRLSNEEVTKARMEIDMKNMMKEINSDWSNGAILINKYGENCKDILENTEERLLYWIDK